MNPYGIVSSGIGTAEAAALRARLMAWHDAMVAHERRLRAGQTADVCDDECPHVEARTLWAETVTVLGPRANELTFLRSRALGAPASSNRLTESSRAVSREGDSVRPSRVTREVSTRGLSKSRAVSSDQSRLATAEL
jgi:hypothetical protein